MFDFSNDSAIFPSPKRRIVKCDGSLDCSKFSSPKCKVYGKKQYTTLAVCRLLKIEETKFNPLKGVSTLTDPLLSSSSLEKDNPLLDLLKAKLRSPYNNAVERFKSVSISATFSLTNI